MFRRSHQRRRVRTSEQGCSRPPTMFGQFYPMGDIFAVLDDQRAAEHAALALKNAGLADEDIDVLEGPRFAAAARAVEGRRSLLARLGAVLASQEGAYVREYVKAADDGRYILVAHAPRPNIVERVHQVLRAHGAHQVRHYGRFTVAELI